MHIRYNPEDYNLWLHYYAGQASQSGYGLEGYKGLPYQRGGGLGSFFRSLFRMAVPVLKRVGKHALAAGANIATDVVQGKPLFEAAKKHTKSETAQILKEAEEALQSGEGLGYRPKSINTPVIDQFTNIKRQNGTRRHKIYSKHKN